MSRYEIVVEGTAGSLVRTAVEGFEVEPLADGRTRLVGDVVDQAYLHSILRRLDDIHVSIVDVHRVE